MLSGKTRSGDRLHTRAANSVPAWFSLSAGCALIGVTAFAKLPVEHLRDASKPVFREGHTLLPLTRWGWSLSFEATVELCENWGYALEFGEANPRSVEQLGDPDSRGAKLCALAASNPNRYPLSVLVYRACNQKTFRQSLPPETWTRDKAGNLVNDTHIWSPLAPDAVFQRAGQVAAEALAEIRTKAPIAIALNGGEYALSVPGHHRKYWEKDPRIMAAKGDTPWFEFISAHKARQEILISEIIRKAVPERDLYIYYYTAGCSHRGRYGGWKRWAWDYEDMRIISDLPNSSIYYRHYNSGWTGNSDMLVHTLNAVGRNLVFDQPLSYNWLNGGWHREKLGQDAWSPLDAYMGYLKCYYTAGMIGGVAGYFSHPKGGFQQDTGDEAPHWLRQMMLLSRAQALFSHVESLVRESDLLPGPNRHVWSKDQPAYEFPNSREGCRILARKHRDNPEWLITVWQPTGEEGQVLVEIPGCASLDLTSRRSGSVYVVRVHENDALVTLVDKDGMLPTTHLR